METTIKNSSNRKPIYLAVTSGLLFFFGLICFIFHISPDTIAKALSEFAQHHYIMSSFISFVVGMICLKFYYSNIK
jgi:cyanate permease